jgi:DNA-binding winged helix-turn-helix (wHTH) protein
VCSYEKRIVEKEEKEKEMDKLPFSLNEHLNEVSKDGQQARLDPAMFWLLKHLIEHAGKPVYKRDLYHIRYRDRENPPSSNKIFEVYICRIRSVLNRLESGLGDRHIRTLPKRKGDSGGWMFVPSPVEHHESLRLNVLSKENDRDSRIVH